MVELAVIGGGPAGLRVAELTAEAGINVHLFDQKRSVGRKFLVAGKSGLNLTNNAMREDFLATYQGNNFPTELWAQIYDSFDNNAVRDWSLSLGQETFVSSGQKVFPKSMKAAPLLRAWVKKIKECGGTFHLSHSLTSITPIKNGYELTFQVEDEIKIVQVKYLVLALGGGSWVQTGSDGAWTSILSKLRVPITPLSASNCGWECPWELDFLTEYEGTPWKNINCSAGGESIKGELVITKYGLEGGPIYRLGYSLRQLSEPILKIDFKPNFTVEELTRKAESVRRNLIEELPKRWKVPQSAIAILRQQKPEIFEREKVTNIAPLAHAIKNIKLPLSTSRPLNEAISSGGGILIIPISMPVVKCLTGKLLLAGFYSKDASALLLGSLVSS